jgi:hypothetical protein
MDLRLPVNGSHTSIDDAIDAMRSHDSRAVVVALSPCQSLCIDELPHRPRRPCKICLWTTSRIKATPLSDWSGTIPAARTRLFSMAPVINQPIAHAQSLFETIGGVVASASKICLCSCKNASHTVFDRKPSLDGAACTKPLPGHATLRCF